MPGCSPPTRSWSSCPFVDESIILGGFYTPSVSGGGLAAGRHAVPRAGAGQGALPASPTSRSLASETSTGRITAVVTDQGRIETEHVVIACGCWSPRIAAMAGAHIPLTPAVHQMIDVGPIPVLEATGNEVGYPIVRDMDMFMYERQTAGSMEVGSYAHRPIFHRRRRDPLHPGVPPVAHGAAVHGRGLRPPARGCAGADAGHPGHSRDQVRDQWAAVPHPRRVPAARRDA